MNDAEKIRENARKIMKMCFNVLPGEKVLIVTDPLISFNIAEALFAAAQELQGEPVILYIEPSRTPGGDPGELAALALAKADVIVTPTSKVLYHCPAMKKALEAGARVGAMTEINELIMQDGAIEADFLAIKPAVDRLAEKFSKGRILEMYTPGGTSLKAVIEGRQGFGQACIFHNPGEGGGIPDAEVNIAPREDAVEGKIVVDACCSTIGLIKTPINLTVRGGRVVEISGGEEAERLKELLAKPADPNCYVVAELAVGMNPKAKLRGNIIEDEGVYGTCHCAVGTNLNSGGVNPAPLHIDMVQWTPTLIIDGETIFKDGKLVGDCLPGAED